MFDVDCIKYRFKFWREAAMESEELFVYDTCQRQAIEALNEQIVEINAIFAFALFFEIEE